MGYIKHNVMIFTSWDKRNLIKVRKFATTLLGSLVTNIKSSNVNSTFTFFIAPDGSKEGWTESDIADDCRQKIADFVNSMAYSDGSNVITFVDVSYSNDDREVLVANNNVVR